MFSSKARYALKAAVHLARKGAWVEGGTAITVRQLAEEGELPPPFLAKVVGELATAGVFYSRKGPGGGVMLARSPGDISLAEVIYAVDRLEGFQRCVLEDMPCSEVESCPLHESCKAIREDILARTTLADILR